MSAAPMCGTCRFVRDRSDVQPGLGECRRNPPTPFQEIRQNQLANKAMAIIVGYWPPVVLAAPDHYCGEWQPKPLAVNDAN
jgi:hypothetical protein